MHSPRRAHRVATPPAPAEDGPRPVALRPQPLYAQSRLSPTSPRGPVGTRRPAQARAARRRRAARRAPDHPHCKRNAVRGRERKDGRPPRARDARGDATESQSRADTGPSTFPPCRPRPRRRRDPPSPPSLPPAIGPSPPPSTPRHRRPVPRSREVVSSPPAGALSETPRWPVARRTETAPTTIRVQMRPRTHHLRVRRAGGLHDGRVRGAGAPRALDGKSVGRAPRICRGAAPVGRAGTHVAREADDAITRGRRAIASAASRARGEPGRDQATEGKRGAQEGRGSGDWRCRAARPHGRAQAAARGARDRGDNASGVVGRRVDARPPRPRWQYSRRPARSERGGRAGARAGQESAGEVPPGRAPRLAGERGGEASPRRSTTRRRLCQRRFQPCTSAGTGCSPARAGSGPPAPKRTMVRADGERGEGGGGTRSAEAMRHAGARAPCAARRPAGRRGAAARASRGFRPAVSLAANAASEQRTPDAAAKRAAAEGRGARGRGSGKRGGGGGVGRGAGGEGGGEGVVEGRGATSERAISTVVRPFSFRAQSRRRPRTRRRCLVRWRAGAR